MIAKSTLPKYAHRYSPKKFTQPQLFVCLVLKIFYKTDYRGIAAILEDSDNIRKVFNLKTVPHFTTLQKASKKLLRWPVADKLLKAIIDVVMKNSVIDLAAIDSTGLETGHVSRYFARRRAKGGKADHVVACRKWAKLSIVCDCKNHLILSAIATRGPTPDVNQFCRTLKPAVKKAKIKTILADAGYDSHGNHEYAREEKNIESIIPAKLGRPSLYGIPPKSKYRRLMRDDFNKETYGQRWQVETVFSMIKRNFGSAVRARRYWSQCRELMLMVLTHNLAVILLAKELFYRAHQVHLITLRVSLVTPCLIDVCGKSFIIEIFIYRISACPKSTNFIIN